jgi:hypothetical protein
MEVLIPLDRFEKIEASIKIKLSYSILAISIISKLNILV